MKLFPCYWLGLASRPRPAHRYFKRSSLRSTLDAHQWHPPRAQDSLVISNRLSRYRSVPRRPPPEGNLWRDPRPGHGTRYGPPPVRPSSHSALLGKDSPQAVAAEELIDI